MPISQYPNGFTHGINIRNVPITVAHPGKIFWVNNSGVYPEKGLPGSNANPGTYLQPYATLAYAMGRCVAGRGDIIMLMPGYSQNITAAAGLNNNTSGVAIVGLGSGGARPRINFTAAAGTHAVTTSAANCSFYNIEWRANVADVSIMLDVAGVDGLTFESCYFTEVGTDLNWVIALDLATGADDLYINKCKFIGNDIANTSCINGVAHDGMYITDSYFACNTAQSVVTGLIATSGNATNVWIDNCAFRSNVDGALWVDFNGAANSGLITNCNVSSIDTAGAQGTLDFTGGHAFNCRVAGEADSWGLEGGGAAVYNNA